MVLKRLLPHPSDNIHALSHDKWTPLHLAILAKKVRFGGFLLRLLMI
jgi:ankyrin repeat protein